MATLTLNGSTSGYVIVTVPPESGANTVTIPAATGTLSLANTSTSGGIFFGGATSGVLYQDATNLYWDDTNNYLGIGTNAPSTYSAPLAVKASDRAVISYFGGATYAVRCGANASVATVEGVDAATGNTSYQPLQIGGSFLSLATGGVERMRILSTGNILSLSGGSTSATGTGIAFPATQSASSDANTLDDYEEGTYTPTVKAGFGGSTLTYSTQYILQSSAAGGANSNTISYVKIGKVVYMAFMLRLVQAAINSRMYVSLPFPIDGSNYGCAGSVGLYNFNQTLNQGTFLANSNGVEAFDLGPGSGTHANLVSNVNSEIYFNFFYHTTT